MMSVLLYQFNLKSNSENVDHQADWSEPILQPQLEQKVYILTLLQILSTDS